MKKSLLNKQIFSNEQKIQSLNQSSKKNEKPKQSNQKSSKAILSLSF